MMKKIVKNGLTLLLGLLLFALLLSIGAAAGEAEDQLYYTLYQSIQAREAGVEFSGREIDKNEVYGVLDRLRGNPELYYLDYCIPWFDQDDRLVTVVFCYKEEVTEETVAAFEAAVSEALECVLPGMDALQTALVLHDYLALHVGYDYENYLQGTVPDSSFRAYGALVNKIAVCQGYAEAYQVLLGRCGIEAAYVSSGQMNHGWTLLHLGDHWYHVDVTWDDPVPDTPGKARHEYFLLSDEAISDEAHGHYDWEAVSACTDTFFDTGMPWTGCETPIPFTDADTYWTLENNGDFSDLTITLVRRSWSQGTAEPAASIKDLWPVWNNPGSYWLGAFSSLACWDQRLFFNDKLRVYAYDPADDTLETVFTYPGGDAYLYGLVYDGTELFCLLKQDPNEERAVLYPISLPEKHPEDVGVLKNGLVEDEDGVWRYYQDNVLQSDYSGLAQNENGWWYVFNGALDLDYTGLATNENGTFYVYNGQVADWRTGCEWVNGEYCEFYRGQLTTWKTDAAVVNPSGDGQTWAAMRCGRVDPGYTGLAYNANGTWYLKDGVLDLSFTGLVTNEYGTFYIYKGQLADWRTGLETVNGELCEFYNGQLTTWKGSELEQYGSDWYYMTAGRVDKAFSGLAQNEYGWWYVFDGKLDLTYVGLATNDYGTFYVYNGQFADWRTGYEWVNGEFCEFYEGQLTTWKTYAAVVNPSGDTVTWTAIRCGRVDPGYTGLAQNEYGWWYISNGALDLSFVGLVTNADGTWFIYNGQLADWITEPRIEAIDGGMYYVYLGQIGTWYTGDLAQDDVTYHVSAGAVTGWN